MYSDGSPRKTSNVLIFFILVLLLGAAAYSPWIFASYGLLPAEFGTVSLIIGSLTPAIVAIALTGWLGGLSGLGALFKGFIRRGFSKKWYLFVFLAPLVLCAIALVPLFILQSGYVLIFGFGFKTATLVAFPLTFLAALTINLWGEIGWRGYAQSALQKRFSVLLSSFIVGFFWAIWQWPLFLVNGSTMANNYLNPLLFGAFTMLISVTYAWVYAGTKGSLLAVSLFSSSLSGFSDLLFFNSAIAHSVFPYFFVVCAALAFGLMFVARRTLWGPAVTAPD
ncbi:MAG: CPBP family glutamic-type intramembrane protease [Candidatus Bathyarchaeia archaeon]|jgi:membrane protease YdiL (CAAX protease family)